MRVALVNPPAAKVIYGPEYELKSIIPCLGLLYMQAFTRDLAEVRVFEGEEYADFEEMIIAINDFDPTVIGLTTNTSTYPLCVSVVQSTSADTYIAGGPYAAFRIQECLDVFDAVCTGDGEVPLRVFLSGMPLNKTPGFAWRDGDKIVQNPPAHLLDLDEIPFPEYPTLTSTSYQASPHRSLPEPWVTMVTSRGCGFRCTFCLSAKGGLNNGRYRERSVTNVQAELSALTCKHGINSVQFWDDTFTMRRKRTRDMTRMLKDFNISYTCNTRSDKIDVAVAHELAESGCRGVFLGVEVGDETLLETDIHKGLNNAQVKQAVKSCKEAGIPVTTSFILGAIHDTRDSINRTVDFALELNADHILFNIYTPHPGTVGYARAVQEGIIDDYTVDLATRHGEPAGIPTICRALSRRELQLLKAKSYLAFHQARPGPESRTAVRVYEEEIRTLEQTLDLP